MVMTESPLRIEETIPGKVMNRPRKTSCIPFGDLSGQLMRMAMMTSMMMMMTKDTRIAVGMKVI
jgi:hypothetical protein